MRMQIAMGRVMVTRLVRVTVETMMVNTRMGKLMSGRRGDVSEWVCEMGLDVVEHVAPWSYERAKAYRTIR